MNNMQKVGYRTISRTVLGIASTAWGLLCGTVQAGLYDTWGYSAPITFNGYRPTETLTNFPALVVLSNGCFSGSSAFAYSQFQSGSNDLAFTDSAGTSNLNYELETWNTNGASYVWVQVPLLSSGTVIKAWWGIGGQSVPACTTNGRTWDANYRVVYHLDQSGNGTAGEFTDSTTNANHGRGGGGTASYCPVPTNGVVIQKAQLFDGADDYIISASTVANSSDFSMEGWLCRTSANSYQRPVTLSDNGPAWWIASGNLGLVHSGTVDWNPASPAVAIPLNQWCHVMVTRGGTTGTVYVNGIQKAQGTWNNTYTFGNFRLGKDLAAPDPYGGGIDEPRVSGIARSSNWVWATYMNMASNATVFQTYGAATASDTPVPPGVANWAPSNITSNAAFLNGQIASTGSAPVTAVSVYWGPTDGGTNAASWSNRTDLAGGSWTNGAALATNLTMASGQDCYYTFAASNSAGLTLATGSKYFITGPLTVTSTDASFGTSGSDTATLVVSRPATCTGAAVTVYYSTSGDATNGVHYTASPASGVLQIAAGATNATLTLTPVLPLGGATRTATVTLLGTGLYPVGSPSSANATEQLGGVVSPAILWSDGDGNGGWINSAGWNDIQTGINNATNNPSTAGSVKLSGNFTRTSGDTAVGSLVISANNITLSGGWDGTFTTQSGRSTLNVNGANTGSDRFRVLKIGGTNVTAGNLVITNGYLWASAAYWSDPNVTCGGGIFVQNTAIGARLTNLVVAGNTASKGWNSGYGGGIQIGTWNTSPGPYGTRVSNCQILGNVAGGEGGGVCVMDAGSSANPVVIENCVIDNNTVNLGESSEASGGGIYATANYAPYLIVANSRLTQNKSANTGAGIGINFANGSHVAGPLVQFYGCLIASNYWLTGATAPDGNAIHQNAGGDTYLVNCTIADNTQPSQPAKAAGFNFSTVDYDYSIRLVLINCVTRNNELGFKVNRLAPTLAHVAYADFQNTDVKESQYVEIDRVEGSLTNTTFAGAISTSGNATPAFRTLTTNGVLSQAIQQNIDGEPNFLGSGSAPYQLSGASTNALDNALKKAGSGYTYLDVDLDGSYTVGGDVIVAGTPPAGNNLVYTNDILGNARVFATGMDRGAYEFPADVNQQFTLSYTAGTGGTISGATNQTVTYGQTGSAVSAVPNSGFNFSLWSDGVGTASRQDGPVTNNLNVTANFVAAALPSISNLPPSNIGVGTATFNGYLVSTGDSPATVYVFWGPNDGTNNAAAWSNAVAFAQGAWAAGSSVWTNMTGLPAQYSFYTFAVSNNTGLAWGVPTSQSFCAGPVTATNTDPICGAAPTDTATITIARPGTCTNLALTVNFAYSGTATQGVHFTANPSGTNITLAAGQASTDLVFTPQAPWNVTADKSITVTLGGGLYPIGTPGSATCTLVKVPPSLYTWDGSTAAWTNTSHWSGGFPGLLPANGSTGIIASGQAQVATTNGLYNPANGETAPAEIRIATNGSLQFAAGVLGQPSFWDHNLILDGGTLGTVDLGGSDVRYDYDLKVRNASILAPYRFRPDQSGILRLFGSLRDYDGVHTGRLTSTNIYGQTWIYSTNNPFSGGWYVPQGVVGAGAPGALGTGDITITNNGTVGWGISGFGHDADVADTNMPSVTVWNGGTLAFCGTDPIAHYSNAPNKTITLKDGGKIGTMGGDRLKSSIDAPIHVSGNVTFEHTSGRKYVWFTGDMISDGSATITWNGKYGSDEGYAAITKADNAYTGNWILTTAASIPYLSAQNDGALGTGSVELRSGSPVLDISQSLKLYNLIYGVGTLGTASRTLTLSPRYRNSTLTDAGVAPGTNWAAAVGTLAVPGNLTLTNLVNYDGIGHDAYSKVNILVTTNAVGVGTNSMVQVAGNLNGLTNAHLTVTVTPMVPAGIYTILTAANDISTQRFHGEAINGGFGHVIYNANNVQVQIETPHGSIYLIR